jgi:hypothetical protein
VENRPSQLKISFLIILPRIFILKSTEYFLKKIFNHIQKILLVFTNKVDLLLILIIPGASKSFLEVFFKPKNLSRNWFYISLSN